MYLYMTATPATALNKLFTPTLLDIVSLWRRGFLSESSTVWVNADHDASAFWALTDHSQFVQLISPPVPGFVRITKSSVRWARTYDDTTKSPLINIDTAKLPAGDKTRVSVIVRHTSPVSPVTVIDGSSAKVLKLDDHGIVEVGHVQVINWPTYTSRGVGQPTQYEQVNAALHGIEFLCDTVDPHSAALLRKYMDDYRVELSLDSLTHIDGMLSQIDQYGVDLVDRLYKLLSMRVQQDGGNIPEPYEEDLSRARRQSHDPEYSE